MNQSFYNFTIGADALRFTFISEGPRPVEKVVLYTDTDWPDFYILSLADLEPDGELNYLSARNNGDLERIMATVAQTLLAFFAHYPAAQVAFAGSTPSRTRLYQIVLARELQAASDKFVISGLLNEAIVPFVTNQTCDGFVVSLPPSAGVS